MSSEQGLLILAMVRSLCDLSSFDFPFSKKIEAGLKDYLRVIDLLQEMIYEEKPLEEIVEGAIKFSDYERVLKEDPESYEDRQENLEALINKAAEWRRERKNPTLVQFLEELSLKSNLDDSSSKDGVRMMTLHHGKGLEFSLVFIVGLEEDLFPHINAKDSIEKLEEERRLCYVGMTRAKQLLYLTATTSRLMWGVVKMMKPSRFLEEVPSHFLNRIHSSIEGGEFKVGMIILHKDFGKGIIKKSYMTSMGLTYDVEFIDIALKRSFLGKYAKFKPCIH